MARILVIDDDPDMRAMLEQTLKPAGHEVSLAADGREGVERYRASPADLVITDLYMANQGGSETIRELRSSFPEVAIIAMYGTTNTRTVQTGAVLLISQQGFEARASGLQGGRVLRRSVPALFLRGPVRFHALTIGRILGRRGQGMDEHGADTDGHQGQQNSAVSLKKPTCPHISS